MNILSGPEFHLSISPQQNLTNPVDSNAAATLKTSSFKNNLLLITSDCVLPVFSIVALCVEKAKAISMTTTVTWLFSFQRMITDDVSAFRAAGGGNGPFCGFSLGYSVKQTTEAFPDAGT